MNIALAAQQAARNQAKYARGPCRLLTAGHEVKSWGCLPKRLWVALAALVVLAVLCGPMSMAWEAFRLPETIPSSGYLHCIGLA